MKASKNGTLRKSIQREVLRTSFQGEIKCKKCGQVQTYDGLGDHGTCTNCSEDLTKELF